MDPITNEILLERVNVVCGKVDRVINCLEGGGTASDPGLKVRVDRLEQAADARKWTIRAVIMGIVGLAANAIVSLIRGTH